MRSYILLMLLILGLLSSGCSTTTADNTTREPLPPDPFPVQLTTYLSTFTVDMKQENAQLILQSIIQRNTTMRENIVLSYVQSQLVDEQQQEQQVKVLFDEEMELYVKKNVKESITFTEFGQYRIVISAEFGGWGQSDTYWIVFDEHGVRVTLE